MANILEFLRGVLTDGDAQGAFRADPVGHLRAAGFGDLAGEDVVEGVAVLRRSLPDELAGALSAFDDEDALPAVRPATNESEIDAAVRVLSFAIDQMPAVAAAATVAETEAAPVPEPEREPEVEPWTASEPAPATDVAAESHIAGTPVEASAPVTVDGSTAPSIAAFVESMVAVASDARHRFDGAVRQVAADAEVQARDVAIRYEALLSQAENDRESARQYLERTQRESDDMLERARQQVEAARRQADELLASSRAETDAARAELEARRDELTDAERRLKERLIDTDSLFRSVLRDEQVDG